jgi:hypothetical protein
MNSVLKKGLIGGLAALTFGLAIAETSSPAMAFGRGGWHGGYGYRGGWGRGYGWGLGGLGAGLALGAIAAGAYGYGYGYPGYGYGYGYPAYGYGGCVRPQPVYDTYGYFRGYRAVAVC